MEANEAAPSRKRARASPSSEDPQAIERDEHLWYGDGTLILIAANVEFRVYGGALARHSPVFRDMLALPQPLMDQNTPSASKGLAPTPPCPTVQVTDSPTDLRHFLRAFIPGEIPKPTEAPTFDAVSAWIRLGHKYEVDTLVENGLQYLRRFYPNSLSDYSHSCPGPIRERPSDAQGQAAIAIVNLARLTGSNDLLPLALLECCKLNADIVNGYTREDGTVEYLSPGDIGRCFAAKDALALQTAAACLDVFEDTCIHTSCRNPGECREVLRNSALDFRTTNISSIFVDDLLRHQQTELFIVDTGALCSRCRHKLRKAVEEQRKEFWAALPGHFNVAVAGWAVGGTESD